MTKTILSRDGLEELLVAGTDALALLQDLPRVEQEEHRVGARDVAVGDVGALEREVVHAWRVDEQDALLQERGGVADLEVVDLVRALVTAADGEACARRSKGIGSRLPDV